MRTLKQININKLLFIDIETATNTKRWTEAPDNVAAEWLYKFKFSEGAPQLIPATGGEESVKGFTVDSANVFANYFESLWQQKAALYAEFSRVVCIVVGYMDEGTFRVKTYANEAEGVLLKEFANDLTNFGASEPELRLCGHFIKGFDIPYLVKRLLINRLQVPGLIDTYGAKPWELLHVDTHEIWKFGQGQSATLPSIAMAFGLPTPKDETSGAEVGDVWRAGGIAKVVKYCRKDVVTALNVFKAMRLEEPVNELQVEYVNGAEFDEIPF